MNRRRYRVNPSHLADAEHIVGEMIEFSPGDDRVNAGNSLPPLVKLHPVGPPNAVHEFRPEDDRVQRAILHGRAMFFSALDEAGQSLASAHEFIALLRGEWRNIVRDSNIWSKLTRSLAKPFPFFPLIQSGLLDVAGVALADFWLVCDDRVLQTSAQEWLRENWERVWDSLDDQTKYSLMGQFVKEATRLSIVHRAIMNVIDRMTGHTRVAENNNLSHSLLRENWERVWDAIDDQTKRKFVSQFALEAATLSATNQAVMHVVDRLSGLNAPVGKSNPIAGSTATLSGFTQAEFRSPGNKEKKISASETDESQFT